MYVAVLGKRVLGAEGFVETAGSVEKVGVGCEKLVSVEDVAETGMEVVEKIVVFVVVAAAVVEVTELSAEMGEVGGTKARVVTMEVAVETEAVFVEKTVAR